jgi:hypothetical protein
VNDPDDNKIRDGARTGGPQTITQFFQNSKTSLLYRDQHSTSALDSAYRGDN